MVCPQVEKILVQCFVQDDWRLNLGALITILPAINLQPELQTTFDLKTIMIAVTLQCKVALIFTSKIKVICEVVNLS